MIAHLPWIPWSTVALITVVWSASLLSTALSCYRWGRARAPEHMRLELVDVRGRLGEALRHLEQAEKERDDAADRVRSMKGYAARVRDRMDELSTQPTESERARLRAVGA